MSAENPFRQSNEVDPGRARMIEWEDLAAKQAQEMLQYPKGQALIDMMHRHSDESMALYARQETERTKQ